MFGAIREQIDTIFARDPAAKSTLEVILCYPGFHAILLHRLAHKLYKSGFTTLGRMISQLSRTLTGIEIHPGAQIGSHFFVDHCTGTVIGETAVIGNHVKMYQGVGLVARSLAAGQQLRGQKRHPTIEDRVTIYAGATIMGGDTIVGEGSTIGANVFLTASVPAHSLVIQEEANVKVMDKRSRQKPARPSNL